jgi:hypothetical protein
MAETGKKLTKLNQNDIESSSFTEMINLINQLVPMKIREDNPL